MSVSVFLSLHICVCVHVFFTTNFTSTCRCTASHSRSTSSFLFPILLSPSFLNLEKSPLSLSRLERLVALRIWVFFFLFRRCISDLRVVGFSGFTAGGTVPMLRVACYVRVMAEAVLPRLRGWTLLRVPACVAAAVAHARADIDDVVVLVRVAVGDRKSVV